MHSSQISCHLYGYSNNAMIYGGHQIVIQGLHSKCWGVLLGPHFLPQDMAWGFLRASPTLEDICTSCCTLNHAHIPCTQLSLRQLPQGPVTCFLHHFTFISHYHSLLFYFLQYWSHRSLWSGVLCSFLKFYL